jgi:hypothetical protein
MTPKTIQSRRFIEESVLKYIHILVVEAILQHLRSNNDEAVFYGRYSLDDCLLVFLYWICYYPSYHKLETLSGIPHANFSQIFGLIRTLLYSWAKKEVGGSSAVQRRMIADSKITNPAFSCATLCLDGQKEDRRDMIMSLTNLNKNKQEITLFLVPWTK